ncbi:TBC1 domain family member 2A [Pholidichthys leucotaenia]
MDESSPAGNPSATSSHSLPAHTAEGTLQPTVRISESQEEGQQSRASSSEKDQSPKESQQTAEKDQIPAESQQREQEPDQPDPTRHPNHQHSPTEKKNQLDSSDLISSNDEQKPEQSEPVNFSSAKLNQSEVDFENLADSTVTEVTLNDLHDLLEPNPSCTGTCEPRCERELDPSQDNQNQKDSSSTEKTKKEPLIPHSEDLTVSSLTLDEQNQKKQKKVQLHVSTSKDQDNLRSGLTSTDSLPEKLTLIKPDKKQDHQDSASLDLLDGGPPPANLNLHQGSPLQPNSQKAPTDSGYQQAPPPCLNSKRAPPPPPPPPPPPHLNSKRFPPPTGDPPNHSSPQPEASTLAPPTPPPTIEAFCNQVQPHPGAQSSSGEPKLCGFLHKQGGPLRTWKQRWFSYEEKKNQLLYYRTPQDVMPLGRVELNGAIFTYPLTLEKGTFHIKTRKRIFILKASTQELMLYWLQQLQVKRWQHRQSITCSDPTNTTDSNSATDEFLPVLKSPLGLVGEEAAANAATQLSPLINMSIKHPLIEIQNSVHCLRKRSSQDWTPSVFHVEDPSQSPDNDTVAASSAPSTSSEPPSLCPLSPSVDTSVAQDGGESVSLLEKRATRRLKSRRRDTLSSPAVARLQQEKQILMEEVKSQKELVWILHKALEASQLEKRTCAEFVAADSEQERLELLRHRERQAADLRRRLEEAKVQEEVAKRSLAQREVQLEELQEKVRMMKEKNNAKQEVIIKLSDQVSTCLSDPRHPASFCDASMDSQKIQQLQQEIENLKDDIDAIKTQNKFLNSEIHQLTGLWRKSSEQEKNLMMKCAYLEATKCQMESRYLGVLRTLQEFKSLEPGQREAVEQMVEDALKGELRSIMKLSADREHDDYGFKIVPDYEVEDMKLLAQIQALEIRSHNLLNQEGLECPLVNRWDQYLAGRSGNLCASPELKALVRGGVPKEHRQKVWSWLIRLRTGAIRDRHPERYEQLCEKSRTSPHPASRQIQLDLHRTLTTNQNFSSPSSPALQQLRRILLAFSWHNPIIGYCQGLNRVAAIALLVLQSEEAAFWCLVTVVESIMPQDYYTKNLVASQADQRVLKDFLSEKLPRLASHFEDHGIDISLITFNWFLVVFVENLPSDILLPLWDAFLYEGTKVIFRYTLALFKYKEDEILKLNESVEIYRYLRFFTKTITDSRKLISIAFGDMNPFPRRQLKNRRALHLERLQAELRELEEQQWEFITESAERKDKDVDTVMSEDDDEF